MRTLFLVLLAIAFGGILGHLLGVSARTVGEVRGPFREPSPNDLARRTDDPAALLDRCLDVIENEILSLEPADVPPGTPLHGAAVLTKADRATVLMALTPRPGRDIDPAEIQVIDVYSASERETRPPPEACILLATHEPGPEGLAAIARAGFDTLLYLFAYEDTETGGDRSSDLHVLEELFRCPQGTYSPKNRYWCAWDLGELAALLDAEARTAALERVARLERTYTDSSRAPELPDDAPSPER